MPSALVVTTLAKGTVYSLSHETQEFIKCTNAIDIAKNKHWWAVVDTGAKYLTCVHNYLSWYSVVDTTTIHGLDWVQPSTTCNQSMYALHSNSCVVIVNAEYR